MALLTLLVLLSFAAGGLGNEDHNAPILTGPTQVEAGEKRTWTCAASAKSKAPNTYFRGEDGKTIHNEVEKSTSYNRDDNGTIMLYIVTSKLAMSLPPTKTRFTLTCVSELDTKLNDSLDISVYDIHSVVNKLMKELPGLKQLKQEVSSLKQLKQEVFSLKQLKQEVSDLKQLKQEVSDLKQLKQEVSGLKRQATATIAFAASLKSNQRLVGRGKTVIFGGVNVNDGNAYDRKTGEFTTPISGLYQFHTTLHTSCNGCNAFVHIIAGNTPVAALTTHAVPHQTQVSVTGIARLSKGVKVRVATRWSPNDLFGDKHRPLSVFNGFLIKPF